MRLKIINKSGEKVELNQKELYPMGIVDSHYYDMDKIFILDSFHSLSYTEFYGIGGWVEYDERRMKKYLDSLLYQELNVEIQSRSSLNEFGNSLMVYEFEKMDNFK